MQNVHKLFRTSIFALILLLSLSIQTKAQCTFAIPSSDSTAVFSAPYTSIVCYTKAYNWICAGDTVVLTGGCGGANYPSPFLGIFFLEPGAVFLHTGGGGSYTIYAKANAYYLGGGGGSNVLYGDPTATFVNAGTPTRCSVTFDYSHAPSNGCNFTPTPVAKFNAGNTQTCTGSSVTFTDQSTGSPTSWKWTFPGGTPPTSTAQNPTVVYNNPGSFDVKLVVSNNGGKDSVTKTALINVTTTPDAGAIITPAPICAGNALNLSDTGSTGTIQWQSGTPGNFTNINGATSATYSTPQLSQSTYYRVVTSNANCTDTSAAVMATVNPLPGIPTLSASDSLICTSDSAYIQAVQVYNSYTWNNGDTTNYTIANAAGDYWLTVTDANNCTAVSAHTQIAVYPAQSVSIIVRGDTLTSFGATGYHWLFNGDTIANALNPLYVAAQPGIYAVQVTDTNGCTTLSSPVTITSITDLPGYAHIKLYPNPTSTNNVQLVVDNDLLGSRLELYDDNARLVFQSLISSSKSEIDLNMAKGIYWLRIASGNETIVRKLVRL